MFDSAPWYIASFAILGLCVGSFVNVVILRLPKILNLHSSSAQSQTIEAKHERAKAQSIQDHPIDLSQNLDLTLSTPPSHCPQCGYRLVWYEIIPLLSYLFLRGRCSNCHGAISWRYPVIEGVCSLFFCYCAWRWHFSLAAPSYALFIISLLTLAVIDWETLYLPDDITVPLIWLGLVLAAAAQLPSVSLHQALFGAVAGYLSLWSIYWIFKWLTHKEGMGYGDFKLFAAIGAWLGWQALIPVILVASVSGALIGLALKWRNQSREVDGQSGYIPFGPFLFFGSLVQILTGWQI